MDASRDERETVDVSLFIISYNRAEYLAEAVKSALDQTHRPRDITILDNGSTPDVKAAMEPLLERGVTWIGSDHTNSPSWNIRRAFTLAQGKYFVAMHDDDRLLPNFLKEQTDFLDRFPKIVAVGCNAIKIDSHGKRYGPLLTDVHKQVRLFENSAEIALFYSSDDFLIFPSIMYRNGCAQKRDFREKEFGKVGDCIYLCDLAQVGPVAYQNRMLYEYRIHARQDSMEMPEQTVRARDRELLHYASNSSNLARKIRRNLATSQILRAYMILGKKNDDSPRLVVFFRQIECVRPEIFTMGAFFSGTGRSTRRFLGALWNSLKGKLTK